MTDVFGDADPEDAWDDVDPLHVRLALAVRILAAIVDDADPVRAVRRRVELGRLLRKLAVELEAG